MERLLSVVSLASDVRLLGSQSLAPAAAGNIYDQAGRRDRIPVLRRLPRAVLPIPANRRPGISKGLMTMRTAYRVLAYLLASPAAVRASLIAFGNDGCPGA
jgi:hypothetical protein